MKSFKTGIQNCARCGHHHENLEFKPFQRNVDGLEATHFCLCPINGEPIIMFQYDDTAKFEASDALHRMQNIVKAIKERMPTGHSFMVFVLPHTVEGKPNDNKRAHYAGTLERPVAIATAKEWLMRNGAAEDWMKHIL